MAEPDQVKRPEDPVSLELAGGGGVLIREVRPFPEPLEKVRLRPSRQLPS